jgi:S-adenosylmethionine hydrolase
MPVPPRSRLITLLTDFGARDYFVGVMKAVIHSIAPRARVIDICHGIEPYAIAPARFVLEQSWKYCPPGTIHVCIVDPGVGGARRPLLAGAEGHFFIGPDNGLLGGVAALPRAWVRCLANPKYRLKEVSATFHGRDVFAPAAAHLAAGVPPSRFGPLVKDPVRLETGVPLRTGKRFWQGEIAWVDRFGNLITNFPAANFPQIHQRPFTLKAGFAALRELTPNYASAPPGEPILLIGSSGHLEIAVNQDSAARKLGLALGSPVELEIP